MTDPLTTPEHDLRAFPFMALDVARLRDSDLASVPDAEVFRVAVLSWCVSWHQLPAASLPNDDATLARLLGFGRDLRGWKKARDAGGLRGWILCSDGRLYHPVVAEKAREALVRKQASQRKRLADKERLDRWRETQKETRCDTHSETDLKRVSTHKDRIGSDNIISNQTPSPSPSSDPPREDNPATTATTPAAVCDDSCKPLSRKAKGNESIVVKLAVQSGNLLGLIQAFGAKVGESRDFEWKRDCEGVTFGSIALIFAWRRHNRIPIREPSGWRNAYATWRELDRNSRLHFAALLLPEYGLMLPQELNEESKVHP